MAENSSSGGSDHELRDLAEPLSNLPRSGLLRLLAAERRLAGALARPAEELRFYLLAVQEGAVLLEGDRAALCLVEPAVRRHLRVIAGWGAMAGEEGELFPVDGSFAGRVLSGQAPVRSMDVGAEPDVFRSRHSQPWTGPALAV